MQTIWRCPTHAQTDGVGSFSGIRGNRDRDAVKMAGSAIKRSVTKISDSIKQAVSGADDDNDRDSGESAAP